MRKHFTQLLFLLVTLGWASGVLAETAWWGDSKLLATDGEERDWFGASVSLSGDRVVVGAYYDDDLGLISGSAYVFRALDAIDPIPDVKVNGVDESLTLSDTQEITLSGRLLAGEAVSDVDYWLFAETPEGTFYYVHATMCWVLPRSVLRNG